MTLSTSQLIAGAAALLIVFVLGRIIWRFAGRIAEPAEDWFEDTFESAPAAAKVFVLAIAGSIFLVLIGGVAFEVWRHFGVLQTKSTQLVAYLDKEKF